MKYKLAIFLFLIISWCGVIFYFSSKTSDESNKASKDLINTSLKFTLNITNKIHLTNIEVTDKYINKLVTRLNYPVRKCAHATVYFILAILLFIFLKVVGLKKSLAFFISIVFCFIFSLTDEYHQTFVAERTGQFSDCLIDTTGSIIGAGISFLLSKKENKQQQSIKK